MFHTPAISELLLWHAKSISIEGLLRHPCDSKTWRHVHEVVDCSFGNDDCNIHLGLPADGMNPFKQQRCSWNT